MTRIKRAYLPREIAREAQKVLRGTDGRKPAEKGELIFEFSFPIGDDLHKVGIRLIGAGSPGSPFVCAGLFRGDELVKALAPRAEIIGDYDFEGEGYFVSLRLRAADTAIIVFGNPVDGLMFAGPYQTFEDAVAEAESLDNIDWWIGELQDYRL